MLVAPAVAALGAEPPRFAVVVTLANNASVERRAVNQQLCRLRGLVGSLRGVGWSGDVVCQTAGWRQTADVLAALRAVCTRVLQLYVPRYDAGSAGHDTNRTIEEYRAKGRVPPPAGSSVQQRTDGSLTSVKFHAWRLTQYAVVLHTDVDVLFLESPHAALAAAHLKQLIFQAAASETAKRGYMGINTHLMLLRPSLDVYALITANAASGHFIPYTRTEQDVLESLLPPSVGRGADVELGGTAGDLEGGGAFGRRLQATGTAAFSTPDVVMPSHLHCARRIHAPRRRPTPPTVSH